MSFNYVVTAQKATAVSQCLTAKLLHGEDYLIISKLNIIEISKVTQDGIKPIYEQTVFGRIEALRAFRPPGYDKDFLFLLTHKHQVAFLECVETGTDSIELATRRYGDISDMASRPAELGNIVIIDPKCKVVGLRLHDGLLKVIPIDFRNRSEEIEFFNIRMEENSVQDITFLHGFSNPTVAFIYKEQGGNSHLRTYEISIKEKEFIQGPWSRESIANEANYIIPVPSPYGGAIVVAVETIVYINGDKEVPIAPDVIKQSPINCYTRLDKSGQRHLLGDFSGRLLCLTLLASEYRPGDMMQVEEMKIELLGETNVLECMTCIDNGACIFAGSKLGDSQLVRILPEPDKNGSLIEIMDTFTNIGPVLDMCLVDLEKQGQGQLVTCSGYGKSGCLRIIRNGIGINESAWMDVPGIKGLWSLKVGANLAKDNYLLLTFNRDSCLMRCGQDGEFESIPDADGTEVGFDQSTRTALCANVAYQQIIQVGRQTVRLINAVDGKLVEKWQLPAAHYPSLSCIDYGIFQAKNTDKYLALADADILYCFEIKPGQLCLLNKTKLKGQVACLDLIGDANSCPSLLAVGFWLSDTIVLYSFPDAKEVSCEQLSSNTLTRSIIAAKFEDVYYLFCWQGDGTVYYFNIDPTSGCLTNCKKVILGTYHNTAKLFRSQSTTSIFVCSNRPTVIYSRNNKLVFYNVNLKDVNQICSFDTEYYPDSLAIVNNSEIIFGTIDEIQKLHIRTVPLYESPTKIAHQQSTQTFGLLTLRKDYQEGPNYVPCRPSASTQAHSRSYALNMTTSSMKPLNINNPEVSEIETSSFLLIDQHSFEVLHSHEFMPSESAFSILSTKLGEGDDEYYVVGTAFMNNDEPEPKQGRLIVYKWAKESSLQQVAELNVKGCPYSLCEYDHKFLAGINASVNLVELNSRRDLHIECTYVNTTMALFLKRKGDLIIMGDLMRSMCLFTYKSLHADFEEVARDFSSAWMTEIEILDENTFLGSEHLYNLYVCYRDTTATNDQDRAQMTQVGLYHLGDCVNVFQHGSIVVHHPSECNLDVKKTTLFGTIDGVIGLILTLDEDLYRRLEILQESIRKVMPSIGKIDHKRWREFQGNKTTTPSQGFIDGDLVEEFLDLPREKMRAVAKNIGTDTEELVKLVEELSRLH